MEQNPQKFPFNPPMSSNPMNPSLGLANNSLFSSMMQLSDEYYAIFYLDGEACGPRIPFSFDFQHSDLQSSTELWSGYIEGEEDKLVVIVYKRTGNAGWTTYQSLYHNFNEDFKICPQELKNVSYVIEVVNQMGTTIARTPVLKPYTERWFREKLKKFKLDNLRNMMIGKYTSEILWARGRITELTRINEALMSQLEKVLAEYKLIKEENEKLQNQNKYWEQLFSTIATEPPLSSPDSSPPLGSLSSPSSDDFSDIMTFDDMTSPELSELPPISPSMFNTAPDSMTDLLNSQLEYSEVGEMLPTATIASNWTLNIEDNDQVGFESDADAEEEEAVEEISREEQSEKKRKTSVTDRLVGFFSNEKRKEKREYSHNLDDLSVRAESKKEKEMSVKEEMKQPKKEKKSSDNRKRAKKKMDEEFMPQQDRSVFRAEEFIPQNSGFTSAAYGEIPQKEISEDLRVEVSELAFEDDSGPVKPMEEEAFSDPAPVTPDNAAPQLDFTAFYVAQRNVASSFEATQPPQLQQQQQSQSTARRRAASPTISSASAASVLSAPHPMQTISTRSTSMQQSFGVQSQTALPTSTAKIASATSIAVNTMTPSETSVSTTTKHDNSLREEARDKSEREVSSKKVVEKTKDKKKKTAYDSYLTPNPELSLKKSKHAAIVSTPVQDPTPKLAQSKISFVDMSNAYSPAVAPRASPPPPTGPPLPSPGAAAPPPPPPAAVPPPPRPSPGPGAAPPPPPASPVPAASNKGGPPSRPPGPPPPAARVPPAPARGGRGAPVSSASRSASRPQLLPATTTTGALQQPRRNSSTKPAPAEDKAKKASVSSAQKGWSVGGGKSGIGGSQPVLRKKHGDEMEGSIASAEYGGLPLSKSDSAPPKSDDISRRRISTRSLNSSIQEMEQEPKPNETTSASSSVAPKEAKDIDTPKDTPKEDKDVQKKSKAESSSSSWKSVFAFWKRAASRTETESLPVSDRTVRKSQSATEFRDLQSKRDSSNKPNIQPKVQTADAAPQSKSTLLRPFDISKLPLQYKIRFVLLSEKDGKWDKAALDKDGFAEYRSGDRLAISVSNSHTAPIYFTIHSYDVKGSVTSINPRPDEGTLMRLDPFDEKNPKGHFVRRILGSFELPDEFEGERGVHTMKLVVTTDPTTWLADNPNSKKSTDKPNEVLTCVCERKFYLKKTSTPQKAAEKSVSKSEGEAKIDLRKSIPEGDFVPLGSAYPQDQWETILSRLSLKDEPQESSNASDSTESDEVSNENEKEMWQCSKCTLLNDADSLQCNACEHLRTEQTVEWSPV